MTKAAHHHHERKKPMLTAFSLLPAVSPVHVIGRAQIVSETLLAMKCENCGSQVSRPCKTGET